MNRERAIIAGLSGKDRCEISQCVGAAMWRSCLRGIQSQHSLKLEEGERVSHAWVRRWGIGGGWFCKMVCSSKVGFMELLMVSKGLWVCSLRWDNYPIMGPKAPSFTQKILWVLYIWDCKYYSSGVVFIDTSNLNWDKWIWSFPSPLSSWVYTDGFTSPFINIKTIGTHI